MRDVISFNVVTIVGIEVYTLIFRNKLLEIRQDNDQVL